MQGGIMSKYLSLLFAAAVMLLLTPVASFAQEEEASEPEIHYVTATVFKVPPGEEGQKVMAWIDAVTVPMSKVDPNVLHSSVLQHNWGSNSAEIVLAAEYADWASIEADCDECDAWFEANQPAEGTPEREEWDEMAAAFFKAYNGHRDEIYSKNMNRAQ
jgi:hypothetical protein